ncbi:MAG: GNAT family N-acetyltransferase [Lachnospiraceae bacterium]|nr:GNAT family N-acetyltransferase [Lachnospiraceae bacterium]
MIIRRAEDRDLEGVNRLLKQVCSVHAKGRPDLFVDGARKYTDDELYEIFRDDTKPVFAAVDDDGNLLGYCFCMIEDHSTQHQLTPIKSLYIDDLCVDETCRGMNIGRALYEYTKEYAKSIGCYNLTLNVWELNQGAKRFYEKMGLKPLKTGMETIL